VVKNKNFTHSLHLKIKFISPRRHLISSIIYYFNDILLTLDDDYDETVDGAQSSEQGLLHIFISFSDMLNVLFLYYNHNEC